MEFVPACGALMSDDADIGNSTLGAGGAMGGLAFSVRTPADLWPR